MCTIALLVRRFFAPFSGLGACLFLLTACETVWNNPSGEPDTAQNVLYSAFSLRPKHLDPVQSYSEDEAIFTYQIYEPPLQYHYLARPYRLQPGPLLDFPRIDYFGPDGQRLSADAPPEAIAQTVYTLHLRPGILYQPHPAFAKDEAGRFRYHTLSPAELATVRRPADFPHAGTRTLEAEDFVYQIKRLAHPRLNSPILELMTAYLPGLRSLGETLRQEASDGWLDLRRFPLEGVSAQGPHRLEIRIKGHYPQFLYWLTMPFFAPIPWEADRFHAQAGMAERNLTLDAWPVGTGPYMLAENDPNARMVLVRNPNFRGEHYPCEGEAGDAEAGLLQDCGQPLPFIDRVVFAREREGIPYWNKFLQGYYDLSGISSDNFDQAVQLTTQGEVSLSESMRDQGMRLITSVAPSVMYIGFNMLDERVGGTGEAARKIRQAISIALDMEEFTSIFLNERAVIATSPIPPGLFGSRHGEEAINPLTHVWEAGEARRRPIEEARALLAEAGWPGGRHAQTGEALTLYFDSTPNGMGEQARARWLRHQFEQLGIQLVFRLTDFNRFQEKLRQGNVQLFFMGWNGDYPDAENFLFLLHGSQARSGNEGGVNAANYRNPAYDALFDRMKPLPDGAARQALIDEMLALLRRDAPWVWGFHPKSYSLQHGWVHNRKPGSMIRNDLKYQRIDASARQQARARWNRPARWPLGALTLLAGLFAWSAWRHHRAFESSRPGAGL